MEKDNTTIVLIRLIEQLKIPVTRQSISDELQKHPDYGSLLAYSDVLNNWRVPNAAYKLAFEQLVEVPVPFIAFVSKGEFVLVSRLDEKNAVVSNENSNSKILPVDEFKKLYLGSVLVAEKDNTSGEANYTQKRRMEIINNLRQPVFFVGAFVLLITYLLFKTNILSTICPTIACLIFFKTLGLIASVMLLVQSIDADNPWVHKLCGGDSNKNCNAILSSKAAKLTDWLSWSEVGFFYFAGTWLTLLSNSNNSATIQVLSIINLICLPYTFYSVWYQWRVAKQWCVICCAVQVILWLEFFAFLPYLVNGVHLTDFSGWGNVFISSAAPLLAWIIIKPLIIKSKQIEPLKKQLRKFKYNPELFQKMLDTEIKYALPADENSLIIGNKQAEQVITMVSNPYCQPCAKTHKALDEWLASRDDIKLQVIFATANNDKDKKTAVAAHLLSIQDSRNDVSLKNAMGDWYEQKQKNYEAWAKKHPADKMPASYQQLQAQKEWCKMTEVTGTPTLFLNGRRLPKTYQTEDLKYFV